MYIKRFLEQSFLEMSDFFKAVLVTGARQVGKTTMLQTLAKGHERQYVSLDDPEIRALAKSDPKLFFMRYKPPIIIDEVQYAPELFTQIKIICDNSREKGLFWLTGSQQYSMMKNVSESLAGRIGILNLYPLSFNETRGVNFNTPLKFDLESLMRRESETTPVDVGQVFSFIWAGGMPQLYNATEKQRENYYSSYVSTYIMRDVMELGGITDTLRFQKFLTACAAEVTQQLNLNKLASVAEISQPTASMWLKLLQSLNIVFLLQPYANNKLKRLAKTPKLYFWDGGLCAYLTKWPTPDTLQSGHQAGAFFENFAVSELIKDLNYTTQNVDLTYFRDNNSKEIDLMLEQNGLVHPLEIKLSANPDKSEIKKYNILEKSGVPQGNGGIICMSPTVLPINENNFYIPVHLL